MNDSTLPDKALKIHACSIRQDPCQNGRVRFVFLLACCASIQAQPPTSYSLVLSIPADPARSLGAANGLLPIIADLGQGNLAPGAFFTISVVAQFADGRIGFTCGADPSLVNLQLRSDSGSAVNIRTVRLPAGFGNTRARCVSSAAVLPRDTSLGP